MDGAIEYKILIILAMLQDAIKKTDSFDEEKKDKLLAITNKMLAAAGLENAKLDLSIKELEQIAESSKDLSMDTDITTIFKALQLKIEGRHPESVLLLKDSLQNYNKH